MLPRCGRVAHICEANSILQSVFPAAIAFFETVKFAILWFVRNKLQIRTRQRGNCSTLAGKSRGGTPFCRTLKTVFPKRSSSRNTTRIRFGKAGAHPQLALGIAIAPETLSFITTFLIWRQLRFFRFVLRFLFHFIMQFDLLRKCGLLAHTSPTFLRNCWIKKLFILPAARMPQPIPHKTKPADPCFRQEPAGFFVSKCS